MQIARKLMASTIAAVIVAGTAYAQEVTLRLGTAAPANTIWQTQFDRFAADLAEETDGRVKVDIFYNGQLGSERTVIAQVARGRIDMTLASLSSVADQVPEAYLAAMHFFYSDREVRACTLDAVRGEFQELVSGKGFAMLDWFEVGTAGLSGSEAYTTPESVKNKRIGVSSNEISNKFWEILGAEPVLTPAVEAASNIGTGLVDVYPSLPVFYVFAGINKVAPVWTTLDHVLAPGMLLISEKTWAKLSEEDRQGFARALARHSVAERSAEFFAFEDAVMSKHTGAGGKIVDLSEEEKAAWLALVPPFMEKVLEETTQEGRDFFAAVVAAKAGCEAG